MQDIAAAAVIALVFAGVALAALYAWALTRFFNELRQREPEVWAAIGSPNLYDMLLHPAERFSMFYAFLPELRARRRSGCKHAANAWRLLVAGLVYCVILALAVLVLAMA